MWNKAGLFGLTCLPFEGFPFLHFLQIDEHISAFRNRMADNDVILSRSQELVVFPLLLALVGVLLCYRIDHLDECDGDSCSGENH